MSIITMSTSLIAGAFKWGQKRYDQAEASDANGHTAARLLGPPRWVVAMESPQRATEAQAALWQAMTLNLRGRVNHLALWDVARPAPLGTMRGTLTLNGAHSAGAVALSVTGGAGQAGTTLAAGDGLQIGSGLTSQLVQVMAAATANGSGVIALTVEPPLRTGYSGGTAVTWDKALAHFKQMNASTMWGYDPGYLTKSGYALDLLEQWT